MSDTPPPAVPSTPPLSMVSLLPRCVAGGVLMGLANLVPGISGGTMLLAAGIYPRFIDAIAKVTRFRLGQEPVVVLGTVVLSALAAIVLFAGPVKDLVVNYRWAMYSLFIGLTLGGVPIVWGLLKQAKAYGRQPSGKAVSVPAALGFFVGLVGMVLLALVQMQGGDSASGGSVMGLFGLEDSAAAGWGLMLIAGVAGASAMILPGVSGGYLFLVLGAYVPILAAIAACKDAVSSRDWEALNEPAAMVVVPVGLGVLIGVAVVSNVLQWCLKHYERLTLGVLLGLLIGAVAGLWPFQQGVAPTQGQFLKGMLVADGPYVEKLGDESVRGLHTVVQKLVDEANRTVILGKPVDPEDYPTQMFTPTTPQIAGAVGLVVVGFAVTAGVARFGREKPNSSSSPDA